MKISDKSKGILFIILAAFFFSTMTVFVKLAGDLPTFEKVMFRNLVASFVAIILFIRSGEKLTVIKYNLKDLILRSLFGTIGMIGNYYAIDHMNISDANMLSKLAPFFAILMSAILLKEKANKIDWICIFVAFCGALLVIKPGFSLTTGSAIIGVIGAFGAGTAYTCVRKLGKNGVRGPIIVMFFSVTSTIFVIPLFISQYEPLSARSLFYLIMVGVAATGGQFSVTAAYKFAAAKDITVYDYSQVVFAAIWGLILFAQIPDIFSLLGYVIIIGSAVARFIKNKNTA